MSAPLHSEPESKSIVEYSLPDVDRERIRIYFQIWIHSDLERYSNFCRMYNRLIKDWAKAVRLDGLDAEVPVDPKFAEIFRI